VKRNSHPPHYFRHHQSLALVKDNHNPIRPALPSDDQNKSTPTPDNQQKGFDYPANDYKCSRSAAVPPHPPDPLRATPTTHSNTPYHVPHIADNQSTSNPSHCLHRRRTAIPYTTHFAPHPPCSLRGDKTSYNLTYSTMPRRDEPVDCTSIKDWRRRSAKNTCYRAPSWRSIATDAGGVSRCCRVLTFPRRVIEARGVHDSMYRVGLWVRRLYRCHCILNRLVLCCCCCYLM